MSEPRQSVFTDAETRRLFLVAASAMASLSMACLNDPHVPRDMATRLNDDQQYLAGCDWTILGWDTSDPPNDPDVQVLLVKAGYITPSKPTLDKLYLRQFSTKVTHTEPGPQPVRTGEGYVVFEGRASFPQVGGTDVVNLVIEGVRYSFPMSRVLHIEWANR